MTDWADGIAIRNNGIKCVIDPRVRSEFLRNIISLGLIAGALLFYSWVRSQIIDTGYETQKLVETEELLLGLQETLIAEEETLTSPMRIEMIATRELGMMRMRPSQLIVQPAPVLDSGHSDSLAMADSKPDGLKKSGESKRFVNHSIN